LIRLALGRLYPEEFGVFPSVAPINVPPKRADDGAVWPRREAWISGGKDGRRIERQSQTRRIECSADR
jgi:hypothetical protein